MADWSQLEVELVVADYLSMLGDELAGKAYSKAAHRRALMPLLNNRSDGSIEFKYQNVSAALIDLGALYIKGYLPRFNYQAILRNECIKQLEIQKPYWNTVFETFADDLSLPKTAIDFSQLIDTMPETTEPKSTLKSPTKKKPFKKNYLELEQQNLHTGGLGEQIAMDYERWRLISIGKGSFADRIEKVSDYDDGAGFDILSKNDNGSDRYIEVKSTKLSKKTPIFFSYGEYKFASDNRTNYHLYRVFNLTSRPRMFTANGDFDSFCQKETSQFKGYF